VPADCRLPALLVAEALVCLVARAVDLVGVLPAADLVGSLRDLVQNRVADSLSLLALEVLLHLLVAGELLRFFHHVAQSGHDLLHFVSSTRVGSNGCEYRRGGRCQFP
jgi:hypothetical protein